MGFRNILLLFDDFRLSSKSLVYQFPFLKTSLFCMLVWKEGDTCHSRCVEVREHSVAVTFFFPTVGQENEVWVLRLGCKYFFTESSWWPLMISFYKCFLEFFLHTEKGVTWKGKQPPTLGNVMKKLECLQLTAFYRLWISKHRMKWRRINICFGVEIFALWGVQWDHSHLYCRRRMLRMQ